MLTPIEKRILATIAVLLGIGFLSKIFTDQSVKEFTPANQSAITTQAGSGTDTSEKQPDSLDSPGPPEKKTPSQPNSLVDVNHADKKALQTLPGIGPVLAGAIVEYRNKFGLFQKKTDMLKVKGIGVKKLEKITPLIIINTGN